MDGRDAPLVASHNIESERRIRAQYEVSGEIEFVWGLEAPHYYCA